MGKTPKAKKHIESWAGEHSRHGEERINRSTSTDQSRHSDSDDLQITLQLKNTLMQSIKEAKLAIPTPPTPPKRKVDNGEDDHYVSPHDRRGDEFSQSQKRVRSNDWRLRNRQLSPKQGRLGRRDSESRLRSRRGHSADRVRNGSTPRERKSRFIEGSMDDRASERPPSSVIGEDEDEMLLQYLSGEETGEHQPRTLKKKSRQRQDLRNENTQRTSSTDTEASNTKQSGIFRFGKTIASAFNPIGLWGNFSEIWKGSQDSAKTSPLDILDDRQARAEAAYAELKASGYKGTAKVAWSGHAVQEELPARNHTSDRFSTSRSHRRNESVSSFGTDIPPTPFKGDLGSSIRSSFRDLRKAASYVSMPGARGQDTVDGELPDTIRKQQSRKDLLRQQKLIKKVSNLEDKLERARRNLRAIEANAEQAPPTPSMPYHETKDHRKFVPGALPSLPSERILYPESNDTLAGPPSTATHRPVHLPEPTTEERPRLTLRRATARINPETTSSARKSALKKPDLDNDQSDDTDGPAFHTRKRGPAPPLTASPQKMSHIEISASPNSQLRRQPARKVKTHKRQSDIYVDPFTVNFNTFSSTPVNHSYSTRSRPLRLNADGNNKPITVTPGRNGKEYIPPVPPIPSKLSRSTKNDDFEWPQDVF